jgi:hypothetical protein
VNTLHVFPEGTVTQSLAEPPAPLATTPAQPSFKALLMRSLGK